MIHILAMAENHKWITKLEKLGTTYDYNVHWVSSESGLLEESKVRHYQVVILPVSTNYDAYQVCERVREQYPHMSVLLAFRADTEMDTKRAFRSGASNILFLNTPLESLREDIELAVSTSKHKVDEQPLSTEYAKVITVASTKGGIGKTTVAVNLAAAYGKQLFKVAIIDLDLQFGDVAMFLDLKPRYTIYDWIKEDKRGTEIERYMTSYDNGISILAAPQRPEFAELITGEDVKKAIQNMKKRFDVIIIDVSSHMNDSVIVALEHSDDILVMTHLDLPTLKNTKLLLNTLGSLQLGNRAKVVLNRYMKVKGITLDIVEQITEQDIMATLPSMDKGMINAINEGKPICYVSPRSKVSKCMIKMVEQLRGTKEKSQSKQKKVGQILEVGGHA